MVRPSYRYRLNTDDTLHSQVDSDSLGAPDVAIVVVTHNRPQGLQAVLDDLAASKEPHLIKELLVIENGDPVCGSERVYQNTKMPFPTFYFCQTSPKKSKALNFALAWTTCRLIVFLDDDVRVPPQTISAYIDAARHYGPGHHFAGPIIPDVAVQPPAWLISHLPLSARGFDLGESEVDICLPIIVGSNWAAFRTDILAADGFPEYLGPGTGYVGGGEESVMQMRLLATGSKGLYVPSAVVRHHVPAGGNSYEFALRRKYAYGRVMTFAEHVENGTPAPRFPPRWMFRRLAALYITRLLQRDRGACAEVNMDIAEIKGRISGYRYLKERSLVSEHQPARWRAVAKGTF
jgi:GT2 family glycosyltransferase